MANGNMGSIGKTSVLAPVMDTAQKAVKAGKIKSLKVKVKFDKSKKTNGQS